MTVIVGQRPQSNPLVGSLVTQGEKRVPYIVNRGSGYSNPDHRWRWACAVCTFTFEDRDQEACQLVVDAHKCGAGWCAVPLTPDRARLLGAAPRIRVGDKEYSIYEPTPEDRERWRKLRERKLRG